MIIRSGLHALWNEPCSTIVKDSLRFYGMGWPMMHFMKILPINRRNHAKAMETMRKAADMVKEDKVRSPFSPAFLLFR